MFLISVFLHQVLRIYATLWLLITLCNMQKSLAKQLQGKQLHILPYITFINWAILEYSSPRVPFCISFLVARESGINFLEL